MTYGITRRDFSAGLLATGALAATRHSALGKLGANERIRVAVIGCRNRGWQNARDFQRNGRFEIATLCDVDRAMIDRAMKILQESKDEKKRLPKTPKIEKDFRRVLDDPGIDAIINATPDHWHALITLHALEAGKHVFHEKPASYCIDEGKAMVAAQQRHPNLVVCVGTQQRSGQHPGRSQKCDSLPPGQYHVHAESPAQLRRNPSGVQGRPGGQSLDEPGVPIALDATRFNPSYSIAPPCIGYLALYY